MSLKLNQFYIMKFNSSRLKNVDYKLNITLNESRRNNEVITISENQLIRTLRKITEKEFDQNKLSELKIEIKKIKKSPNTKENKKRLIELENQIDLILFIPEIISLVVNDNRHYKKIVKNGLIINNEKYVRFIVGSGNARRNTVIMVQEKYFEKLICVLDNGRNPNKELVPPKYSSYFGLYNSGGWPVSTPRIVVIKDALVKRNIEVDFISENETVEKKIIENEFNLFDGQGIASVQIAQQWASDLSLDYIPSTFIVRASFIKGMCCVMDIHRFAREIAHNSFIEDVWGNSINIDDVDILISQSQFKLWDSYSSLSEYIDNCQQNDLGWSVSRYSPVEDKTSVRSNYQFLQVLNLDDNQIKSLCQPTVDFLNGSILDDYRFGLLYLLGNYVAKDVDEKWFDGISDPVVKAMFINREMFKDSYIQNHIIKSLNRKIRDSYIGSLYLNGNYSSLISDPIAQLEHAFNIPINGFLKIGEYYSHFWNERNIEKIVACRAPLTWRSETDVLDLVIRNKLEDWYSYLQNGLVLNIHGFDTLLFSDADFDGDMILTTDKKEFIDGAYKGLLPIAYEKKNAPKQIINSDKLWETDLNLFNSKIGFITNTSTSFYNMLPLFDEDTYEYKELINRLKLSRYYQGQNIDRAKGIIAKSLPVHWTRWQKKKPEMSTEEKEKIDFENKLIADRRPYFMRFLYGNYNRKYKKFLQTFESITQCRLGISLQELLSKPEYNLNDEELKIRQGYNKFNPLLDTPSIMNKVAHYLEGQVKELKLNMKNMQFNPEILMDRNIAIDPNKLGQMKKLWGEWKVIKRNHGKEEDGEESEGIQHIAKEFHLRMEKISSNGNELVNLCVQLLYKDNPKSPKDFLWSILGDELLEIIKQNSKRPYSVPVKDENGSIDYMGQKYEMREIWL